MIPFNKPYISGKEAHYIYDAVYQNGHLSGNGEFTKECQCLFEERWGFKKCLLTTSCTDSLEMTAILMNIKPGDEIIVPSYTFVSSALPFIRQGGVIKFVDSRPDHPGKDENRIETLITARTKAIVVVHYAGVACDMDKIMSIANKHELFVVEDAAQAIDSYYKGKPLGSIGHFGCFSFHETKNIQCGEGGLLAINDVKFIKRAEIIWEKGTNRAEFFRGEINKYGWVDVGSSFLPSELNAAYLYAQLENIQLIQQKRKKLYDRYLAGLKELEDKNLIKLPFIPDYAANNGHMFYVVLKSLQQRTALIDHLKANGILSVFHYQSLHKSEFYRDKYTGSELHFADKYTDCLLRLPMYYELKEVEADYIVEKIYDFFE